MSGLKEIWNLIGWKTNERIVVLESDDWGSVRMPSNVAFKSLSDQGIDLVSDEGARYNIYDSIATPEDLSSLFQVLHSIRDCTGRPAVISAISVVANPDFHKIKESDFAEYYYEPITDTFKKQPGCGDSFSMWVEGIKNRLFVPQFHGREHLNVPIWLRALKRGHEKARKAFEYGFWGFSTANDPDIKIELQAAFDFIDPVDLIYQKEVVVSGLELFERLFGYRASYFVPPNGPINSELEKTCFAGGIRYLSVPRLQIEPVGYGKTRKKIHWIGQNGKSGILYLTRNCFFEPNITGKDWVDYCMRDIANAFKWGKPAIISTHRVNYIGALNQDNRIRSLKELELLLRKIFESWPDARFLTSAELGDLLSNGR